MNLKNKIELYYGNSPIKSESESMQQSLLRENEFCALYVQNNVPAYINNQTNDMMLAKFGVNSHFAEKNSYIRPFQVNVKTGLAEVGIMDANANVLRDSGYRVGGIFFDMSIADTVLNEFKNLGYEVIKKYD